MKNEAVTRFITFHETSEWEETARRVVPTMKPIDQPKTEEKAEKLPADFECACNTCPSQEACKAAQDAEKSTR